MTALAEPLEVGRIVPLSDSAAHRLLTDVSQPNVVPVWGPEPRATRAGNFPNIVLVGRMHSGKSSAANSLRAILGYAHVSFAAKLKEICNELFINPERAEQQTLGMAVRDIDEDAWARYAANQAELVNATGRVWVCDDCRFPNEVSHLTAQGCIFIRLECDEGVRRQRLMETGRLTDEAQLTHASETSLDDFVADYTIDTTHLAKQQVFNEILTIIDKERNK